MSHGYQAVRDEEADDFFEAGDDGGFEAYGTPPAALEIRSVLLAVSFLMDSDAQSEPGGASTLAWARCCFSGSLQSAST